MTEGAAEQNQKLPNLSEIRKRYTERLAKVYKNPLELQYNIEWNVLCEANPEQMTIELAERHISAYEAYLREEVNQDLAEFPNSPYTEHRFEVWSRVNDALQGIKGKAPILKTIDYLRNDAAGWRMLIGSNRKIMEKGGPFAENPLQEMTRMQEQIESWEHISENLDTAARLFENQPKFTVAPEEPAPEVK